MDEGVVGMEVGEGLEGLGELVEDVSFNERVSGWRGVWVSLKYL